MLRAAVTGVFAIIDSAGTRYGLVVPDDRRREVLPLTEAERRKVLVDWNDTALDFPNDRCIHDLFEEQAQRTPDAVAVVFGDERVTYRQLDERANHLAHRLKQLGVGPETLVAIAAERSAQMVIGLLGILKAGGAYVPVDPSYPADRIAYILADSRAPVLVTQPSLQQQLPPHASVVLIDEGSSGKAPHTSGRRPGPANLAYLIYTSGSTGRPKAVAIEHRNAVAFLTWAGQTFAKGRLGAVLASTSICFDLSVFEIFGTLSSGGTIFVAANALQLPDLPAASAVTLVNTVPSAIAELLARMPSSVRTLNLAGEPLKDALVQQLYALGHVDEVFDLYGPSETTTYSTFTLRKKGTGSVASIGRPIANTQVYLLDPMLQPVPIGIPGELYIGGAGVARGYLARPDLTAERFVPNPFASQSGARMYRTGDLARFYPDGNIEYLGRLDHQVKIRGFRIELGEIEVALLALPGIRDALVVAREDVPGDKRLVAYVVPKDAGPLLVTDLRAGLEKSLPEYMTPSAFVTLKELPLTPNGKVDRKSLPPPDWDALRKEYLAPRTSVEESLTAIWAQVLGLERVGILDNFFELGGHSLLAAALLAQIRTTFEVELPLRVIFEDPTVAALGTQVVRARASQIDSALLQQMLDEVTQGTP